MSDEGKVYVGNIPFTTTEEDLQHCFEQCGKVREATIVTDRESGRSR
ncbi:hypothetical protein [Salmonella sp. s51933]